MSDREIRNVIVYDSNNSGGSWWLKTRDWEALEAAGWNVHWVEQPTDGLMRGWGRPMAKYEDPLRPCPRSNDPDAKWLGARAMSAAKETTDPNAAIKEWEEVTGQTAGDLGCGCCGPPHSFEFYDDKGEHHYASAEVVESRCTFAAAPSLSPPPDPEDE